MNRHKICVANTHIATTADVPYDVLCERLVNEAQRKQDVPRIVEDFMDRNRVQGGRILVSSPEWTFLVEVFQKIFKLKEVEGNFVITNSFSLISYEAEGPDLPPKKWTIR